MVQKSGEKTTWDVRNPVNHGRSYQPQLVQDFFHQQYYLEYVQFSCQEQVALRGKENYLAMSELSDQICLAWSPR